MIKNRLRSGNWGSGAACGTARLRRIDATVAGLAPNSEKAQGPPGGPWQRRV